MFQALHLKHFLNKDFKHTNHNFWLSDQRRQCIGGGKKLLSASFFAITMKRVSIGRNNRRFAGAVFGSFRQPNVTCARGVGVYIGECGAAGSVYSPLRPGPRPRWVAKNCDIRRQRTTRYNLALENPTFDRQTVT